MLDLKTLRNEKEMKGCEVAEKCKISYQYYNFIENERRRPSVEVAKRIAGVLGFEWTRFFEEEEHGKVSCGAGEERG